MRLLALALVAVSGCSWIGVTPPPEHPVTTSPRSECTVSEIAPVVDTVVAVLTTGVAVTFVGIIATADQPDGGAAAAGLATAAVAALIGALYTASAVHGFGAVSACRALP